MVDELSDFAVEIGDNDVADFIVVVDQKLSDKEFSITSLSKLRIGALQLESNLFPLLWGGIFDSSLNCSNCVMLQDEVSDAACDDAIQFGHKLLSLVFWNMGLEAQSFPNLLGPLNFISEGFGCFSL